MIIISLTHYRTYTVHWDVTNSLRFDMAEKCTSHEVMRVLFNQENLKKNFKSIYCLVQKCSNAITASTFGKIWLKPEQHKCNRSLQKMNNLLIHWNHCTREPFDLICNAASLYVEYTSFEFSSLVLLKTHPALGVHRWLYQVKHDKHTLIQFLAQD